MIDLVLIQKIKESNFTSRTILKAPNVNCSSKEEIVMKTKAQLSESISRYKSI